MAAGPAWRHPGKKLPRKVRGQHLLDGGPGYGWPRLVLPGASPPPRRNGTKAKAPSTVWSMTKVASSALRRPARGRSLAFVLGALCAAGVLAPWWPTPVSAAPSSLGAPISERGCIAAGGGFSVLEAINGQYLAGQTFTLSDTFSCTSGSRAQPVEDFSISATVSPAGVLELVSGAHPSTNASGAVTFKLHGLKAGQATVRVSADDAGLCTSKLGEAGCSWSLKVNEQPAPGLPPAHPAKQLGILPPHNPAQNAPFPSADWDPRQCTPPGAPGTVRYNTGLGCSLFYLELINTARADEHVPPVQLPSNWTKLTVAEQLFVTADLERVGRGLPPYVGLSRRLDALAQAGAEAGEDPSAPPSGVYGAGSNSSVNSVSATNADYGWMYVDGDAANRPRVHRLRDGGRLSLPTARKERTHLRY
jgi:hypothetical protein